MYTQLTNNFKTVIGYASQSEIRHFYNTVEDYAIHTDHTVIVNDLDVLKTVDHYVYDRLKLNKDAFFLRNKMVSFNPVRLFRADTNEDAIEIGRRKKEKGDTRYYLYQSSKDIEVYGEKDKTVADVLVYKVDGTVYYDGVMSLD